MSFQQQQAQAIYNYYQSHRGKMNPPSTALQVAEAEATLGHPMPSLLRELYSLTNGFRDEDGRGERLLYSLEDLIENTLWLRKELQEEIGASFICFGFCQGLRYFVLRWNEADTPCFGRYDPSSDAGFREVSDNLLAFYMAYEKWLCEDVLRLKWDFGDFRNRTEL